MLLPSKSNIGSPTTSSARQIIRRQHRKQSIIILFSVVLLIIVHHDCHPHQQQLDESRLRSSGKTIFFASSFALYSRSVVKIKPTTAPKNQIRRWTSSSSQDQSQEEGSTVQEGQDANSSSSDSYSTSSSPRRISRNKRSYQHQRTSAYNNKSETFPATRKPTTKNPNSPAYNFWEDRLSITAFNMDLHNLAMEDAEKAQDALEIMEKLYNESLQSHIKNESDNDDTDKANKNVTNPPLLSTSVVRPDSASYTTVIEGWCYGNHYPNAAGKATALLRKMEDSDHLQPNELGYLLVSQKWAESYKDDDREGTKAQKAHDILNRIKERNEIPSVKLYSIVLEGWCRRVGKVKHAMDRVEELLEEMENSQPSTKIRPNVLTYTSVIGGLARSKKRDMATRADQILVDMERNGIEPDMVAYTSILNCWAKTTNIEERQQAASRALAILQKMEDAYLKEENYHVKPNAITYATAIKAIGNSVGPDVPKQVEQVLWHMYNLTDTEKGKKLHVSPNVGTYNAVITSLSTCGRGYGVNKATKLTAARRAEHLLVDMLKRSRNNGEVAVEPNVRSWGGVLRAWAESGVRDSGEQAQRVLDLLEKWYRIGKSPVRPNVVCYTTVMNAWARGYSTSKEVALDNVEKLLKTMETNYEETRDIDIRPNKISYVTAIDAFCRKCKDNAGSRAQATVDRMVRLYSLGIGYDRPTRIVFNALINAWSRSSEPNAAQQAEKIFRWMESQYQAGDACVKPDEVTLSGVLNAWANNALNGGAMRAQEILDHTESLSVEERGFEHSIICHNILIKAWGRSRELDSVQRAEQILANLENRYKENKYSVRPDITTYSSVINCCAYYAGADNEGRSKAFEVALRTFAKLREAGEVPNNITYGTLFKAISKLTTVDEKSREELVKKYFAMCCKEGQVDSFVLSQVRQSSSSELFRELILNPWSLSVEDEHDIDRMIKQMPRKYCRNVNTN